MEEEALCLFSSYFVFFSVPKLMQYLVTKGFFHFQLICFVSASNHSSYIAKSKHGPKVEGVHLGHG